MRASYEAEKELKKRQIVRSRLAHYDAVIGIQIKDTMSQADTKYIKGDLANEMARWLVNFFEEGKNFKQVVNLHEDKTTDVDLIFQCYLKSIRLEEPGISGISKALAIFYGIAPTFEHYAIRKTIDSTATVRFQLLEPKTYTLLWDKVISEKVRDEIQLSRSSRLIFDSIAKTVEVLLAETEFPEELRKLSGQTRITAAAPLPAEQVQSRQEAIAGQRWAVIVGISKYKDTRIPTLRYAADDAQSFYEWIVSPGGRKYAHARVKLLLNKQATGQNIKNALFSWLKQALAEDVVTIYFAGHGSPESPDFPENLFLLAYDTKYDNIAGTGFPMWDIETALKRFIRARKVVVIADACHAGGVGKGFDVTRRASRGLEINPISTGLQNLSKVGDGICVISASNDKQLSQEGKDWGGGHGVFTYFLLQGLKGAADYNQDTYISLGELIPYLSEKVRRATLNAQSPTVSGKFDPALSIGK